MNHATTGTDGDALGEGVGAAVGRLEVTADKGQGVRAATDRGRCTRVGSGYGVYLKDAADQVGVAGVGVGGAADAKETGRCVQACIN